MLEHLKAYYASQGLSIADAPDFKCPHYNECKGDCGHFVTAKATYVGKQYEKADNPFPRLLFLSLDPYKPYEHAEDRTFEAVRQHEEERPDFGKNRHWLQTHQLAARLLNGIAHKFHEPRDVYEYFCNVNSAKCSECKTSMSARRLFDNCRVFLQGELRILKPDIVVTQGKLARKAIESLFDHLIVESIHDGTRNRFEWGTVTLDETQKALWLPTPHPSWLKRIHENPDRHWDHYAALISRFFANHEALP